MTDLVDTGRIESIVGARRHETEHLARAVSEEQRVYILHSKECFDDRGLIALQQCPFSKALDLDGIAHGLWDGFMDRPVVVTLNATTGDLEPERLPPGERGEETT